MDLDLDRLRAFVSFAEEGGFTAGARRLGLSQPALHAKVGRLSEQLGTPLYVREGRTLRLTPRGERLLVFARRQLATQDAFLADFLDEPTRPVRLAAGEGLWLHVLGPLLLEGPALDVHVLDGEGSLQALATGVVDIAVLGQRASASFEHRALGEVGLSLAMPAGHPLDSGALTPERLRGWRWVVPPEGRPLRAQLTEALGSLEVAASVRGWPLTLQLVRSGLGLAVVNAYCEAPTGVVLRALPWLGHRTFWAVRQHVPGPAAREVWAALPGLL